MSDETNVQNVAVTDIRMPFLSMVVFMVKWAIAAIPALIILTVIGMFTFGILGALTRDRMMQSVQASDAGSSPNTLPISAPR
jgi:CHASE2 domain-containing sensor protein